jgi:hypothetical protein
MRQITNHWLLHLLKDYAKIRLVGQCHDCKCEVIIDVDKKKDDYIIQGGLVWKYEEREIPFFKCIECAQIEKRLTNYQDCEVWSRVVGYLRPVKQWNKGKQAEYNQRKNYKNE